MGPSEAISTGESALRAIVRDILGDRWQQLISASDLAETINRKNLEPKVRPGAQETDDLLSYVDTGVLTKLIVDRWSQFAPVFGNVKRTKQCLNAFVVYRRRVAHNRDLLPFERDLLSGLSGMFRNQVSIYLQSRRTSPSFYAQIETSTDSQGTPGKNLFVYSGNPPVIRVGETLTYAATATDPRGRPIEWHLEVSKANYVYATSRAVHSTGDAAQLSWTPEPAHFNSKIFVHLLARNKGTYHALDTGWDDMVSWPYLMEPPY